MAMNWLDNGCKTKEGFWRTREIKLLKIKNMDTEHINHCIEYIKIYGGRLRYFEHNKIDELEKELDKRKKG